MTCSPELAPLGIRVRFDEEADDEEAIHGRTNHRGAARGAGRREGRFWVAELLRKHGISEATFYNWKARHGGMTVSEAKRLKELETEKERLKKLLAEAELDKSALKELLSRKW